MDIAAAIDRYFGRYPTGTVRGSRDTTEYTVFLTGSLDLQYSRDLQELLSWIIDNLEGKMRLVIDMEQVNYISSTGVGALSSALVRAKKRDVTLLLCHVQPKVRSVFELLGLMTFFEETGN